MEAQQFDMTKIKAVDKFDDCAQVNRLLQQDWVLLKATESQWRDDEGALRATVIFTLGQIER